LAVAASFAAAVWPLRDAVFSGKIAGSGPDVIVTMWGMRWFSVEWLGAAWAGPSNFANFPHGTVGSVLAPLTATLWMLFDQALGPSIATTFTDVVMLTAWCAAVAWLGRLSGLRPPAAILAGVLTLSGRYLVFAVGETSIVGITALPVLIGVGALLTYRQQARLPWLVLYAFCTAITGLEYPYVVPLLPIVGALVALKTRDRRLMFAVLVGALLVVAATAARVPRCPPTDHVTVPGQNNRCGVARAT